MLQLDNSCHRDDRTVHYGVVSNLAAGGVTGVLYNFISIPSQISNGTGFYCPVTVKML